MNAIALPWFCPSRGGTVNCGSKRRAGDRAVWAILLVAVSMAFMVPNSLAQGFPPVITNQPGSQRVIAGEKVNFTVGAGPNDPKLPVLTFQWRFSVTNDNYQATNIFRATNFVYSILQVRTNDAGYYWAVAINSAGRATSTVAQLTVLVPPALVSQPRSATNM